MHEGVKYNCNICQYSATHKVLLSSHVRTIHLQERNFQCSTCDYKTTDQSHLTRHIEIKHNPRENFVCADCNKSIKPGSLYGHRKYFHSGEQPKHMCNICTFQTNRKDSLKNHIIVRHKKLK